MFKRICLFIVCTMVLPIAVVASSSTSKKIKPPVSSPVVYVRERSFAELAQFGSEVRAYTLMMGDKRIIIGVDYIRNLSGISEELPSDLSDYVVNAIEKISSQFGTYRKYPGPVGIPGALLAAPPQAEPFKPPPVDFWISGSLERASEITKSDSKKSIDATGGGGKGQFDAHTGRNRTQTIKSLTVTFTLEGPDRVSIPGASATYRIDVEQLQRERSFSVYVAASGLTLDSTVTTTSSLDALSDSTADSIINILGNGLEIPFYRVSSSVFQPDKELDKRVHDALRRLTKQDLEQNLKLWMVVDGYPMVLNDVLHLTDHDRAVVEVEMHHRSLASTVDFAFSLWQTLDYVNGSQRVESYLANVAHARAELQAKLEQQAAAAKAAAKQQEEQQKQQQQAAEATKPAAVPKPSIRHRVARHGRTTSATRACDARTTCKAHVGKPDVSLSIGDPGGIEIVGVLETEAVPAPKISCLVNQKPKDDAICLGGLWIH